ncbi:hypothetical protein [Ralstonia wenshanensis]|uniref:hypothetical protein n=1 Tax=Ralstonia wenshanensis TaxID=2842456 RepID=UPI0039C737D9
METTRIETADVEALAHRLREIRHGLITFDGCMLAGKTGLMREIARRLEVQGLDLDDFVDRQQGVFVEALRLQELIAAIQQASAKSGVVLLSGICMLEVLERIGRESAINCLSSLAEIISTASRNGIGSPCRRSTVCAGRFLDSGVLEVVETEFILVVMPEACSPRLSAADARTLLAVVLLLKLQVCCRFRMYARWERRATAAPSHEGDASRRGQDGFSSYNHCRN